MTGEEFIAAVKKKAGFDIMPETKPAYGTRLPTGKNLILDLDGNFLRYGEQADTDKWNAAWKAVIAEAEAAKKK